MIEFRIDSHDISDMDERLERAFDIKNEWGSEAVSGERNDRMATDNMFRFLQEVSKEKHPPLLNVLFLKIDPQCQHTALYEFLGLFLLASPLSVLGTLNSLYINQVCQNLV